MGGRMLMESVAGSPWCAHLPGGSGIGLRLLARELRQLRAGTDLAVRALQRWLLAAP